MNGLQIFAFVVLPLAVASVGWLIAFCVAPPFKSKVDRSLTPGE